MMEKPILYCQMRPQQPDQRRLGAVGDHLDEV